MMCDILLEMKALRHTLLFTSQISRRDDAVVVLYDDLVRVDPHGLSLHVALQIIVCHLDAELDRVLDVDHAAVGVFLGVDFSVEYLVGADGRDHVCRAAVDGDVVTGGKLVSADHILDYEERLLKMMRNFGVNLMRPSFMRILEFSTFYS